MTTEYLNLAQIADCLSYQGRNKATIPFSITQERLCEHDANITTLCWHVYIEVHTDRDAYDIVTGDPDLTRALKKAMHRLRREIPSLAA